MVKPCIAKDLLGQELPQVRDFEVVKDSETSLLFDTQPRNSQDGGIYKSQFVNFQSLIEEEETKRNYSFYP